MSDLRDALFKQFPRLETERMFLREAQPTDAEATFAVLSTVAVCRYYDLSPLASLDDAAHLIADRAAAFGRRERIRWVLAWKEDNVVIGSCGLSRWREEQAEAEIGYELAPEWQGHGLMQEALTAVLDFGFDRMQLRRVEANVMPENEPSRRLLRRLGFREQELRKGQGHWKGQAHDLILLWLHRKDWHE